MTDTDASAEAPAAVGTGTAAVATGTEIAELAAELRLALIPLVRELRHQAGRDLTPSVVSALAAVQREGPLTLGDLAAREHVSQPMISKVAVTLVELGLAAKVPDPNDRRVTRLEITPEGRRQLERSRTRKNAWLATRIAELGPEEVAAVRAAIPVIERLAGSPARGAAP
jgi:DNA-binding MarR family transcriptional regulator